MELVAHSIPLFSLKQHNFWSVNEKDWRGLLQEIDSVKIFPLECKLCIVIPILLILTKPMQNSKGLYSSVLSFSNLLKEKCAI